jgi:hypothetical protein
MTNQELQKIVTDLSEALDGDDGLSCCGSCFDGLIKVCVCAPAFRAIEALNEIIKERGDTTK